MRTPTVIACSLLLAGCAAPAKPTPIQQYVSGMTYLKNGDTPTAIERLEAAVAANPDLRMARTTLARLYRERGEYDKAVEQYQTLARLDPYTTAHYYYLGLSQQYLKKYAEAAKSYLLGLKIDPNDFRSNLNVGTVFLALGETEKAVQYLEKATRLDAKNASGWSNLGVALDTRGDYAKAEDAYRQALRLETGSLAVLQNLAGNLLLQSKVGEATFLWEQVVKQKPTPFTRTRLADAYTQGGDLDKAEPIVTDVLNADARYVPGFNARARLLVRRYEISGFTDEKARVAAVAAVRRSLQLNPKQPAMADLLKKYQTALPLG